ncbi:MAG: hypothetical protein GXP42_03125 [Chloroflexi bacterium]|nr:hypothetical protein [Chloroflexota bacterium]
MHKGAQILGAFAFAALVPRSLGAELFGQLSFVLSLSLLLQMPGDLGGLDIIGRFVPGWAQEDESGRRKIVWLTWHLIALRLLIGLAVTLVSVPLAPRLASWLTPLDGLLIGLSAAIRLLSWTPFHLSFGLGRMGRWSVELAWRQLVMTPFLLAFARWGVTGLLAGLALSEALFLLLGHYWIRPYLRVQSFDWPALRPYLRFGAGFFLANIVIVALYRLGPVLLEVLARNTVAVGYFNLGVSVYMMLLVILTQYMSSFVPMLSLFHRRGELAAAQRWLDRMVRYTAVLMGVIIIGMFMLMPAVAPLLFGADFAPVTRIMLLLALALLAQPLVWAGRYAAVSFGHPRAAFYATLFGLLAFLAVSPALMPRFAADGAALALGFGVVVMAGVYLWLGREWLKSPWLALAAAYLPLSALLFIYDPARDLMSGLLWSALLIPLYLFLLWLLRVVTTAELAQMRAAFMPGGAPKR